MRRQKYKDKPAASEDGLLDEHDVARIIKVSLSTIRKWRPLGQGPRFLKISAAVRYQREDVMWFLASLPKGGGKTLNA